MMNNETGMTYVKLDEERANLQTVNPGELNQPIDIAQLNAHRCTECGQKLPPTYEPPADEDWSTGIFGCAEDKESCYTGLFCPCVLFARNIEKMQILNDQSEKGACIGHVICVEGGMTLAALTSIFYGVDPHTSFLICEGLFFGWWMCGIYTSMARQTLQRKYHLKDSPCDPCMVHCCLHWFALCQEHREMQRRLESSNANIDTAIDPPPLQAMSATRNNHPLSPARNDHPSSPACNNLPSSPARNNKPSSPARNNNKALSPPRNTNQVSSPARGKNQASSSSSTPTSSAEASKDTTNNLQLQPVSI